uniref:Laccase n=1 Tax=Populus alba TaxID=43335 RepID=A0A4U5Q0V2_POPAL|nr:laccase [Populus alba]
MRVLALQILRFLLFGGFQYVAKAIVHHTFVVKDVPYTRLCSTKNIMTVNGQFPGPTLYVTKGETIIVDVINKSPHNITIHWHGVKQPEYPWSDGPEYITQCPIQPGGKFSQKVIFSDEEGTLWWHAHSDWTRATVYGAIVIYPNKGTRYPFPAPHADVPIILGEWWKEDIFEIYDQFRASGADPNVSDAYTINGQPGDLYPCSKSGTMPLYNCLDFLFYFSYNGNYTPSSTPSLPYLPYFNDTTASVNFTGRLRSLVDNNHPIHVPLSISTPLFFTVSVNRFTCANTSCGATQSRLAASVNNISFQTPTRMDILKAYYNQINGIYDDHFPDKPPLFFNFTADSIPLIYETPSKGVWFVHCHLERHLSWGMEMAFIIKNGRGKNAQMLPPPPYMPPC